MIHIYDGLNVIRRGLHNDPTGMYQHKVVTDMFAVPGPHVWVFDGAGGSAKRREIFPRYKTGRTPYGEDIWATIRLLQELLTYTPAIQVTVPGFEADDVIAALATRWGDVHIHSNDMDFAQLGVKGDFNTKGIPPEQVRLYKTCVGDPRDTIPGIKGFGAKAWDQADKTKLQALIEGGEDVSCLPKSSQKWFLENQQLIKDMWTIIGFLDVPIGLIDANTIQGSTNRAKLNENLSRFHLGSIASTS
jgi:hypothetical protein